MATLGDLVVNMKANNANFNRSMKQSENRVKTFSTGVKAAMGVAVAALATAVSGARVLFRQIEKLDQLAKTSKKLGIDPAELAGLRFAAESAGVGVTALDTSLQRMVRRISEAAMGTGTAVKALDELGLSAVKLSAMTPERQLQHIADAMSKLTDQGDRVRLAMALFDTEGVAMVNMLAEGSKGMREMTKEAEALGLAFTEQELEKIEEAADAALKLGRAWDGIAATLTVKVAPALTGILDDMNDITTGDRPLLSKEPRTSAESHRTLFGKPVYKPGRGPGSKAPVEASGAMGDAQKDAKEAKAAAATPLYDDALKAARDRRDLLTGRTTAIKQEVQKHRDEGVPERDLSLLERTLEATEMLVAQEKELANLKRETEQAQQKELNSAKALVEENKRRAESKAAFLANEADAKALADAQAGVADANQTGAQGPQFAGVAEQGSASALKAILGAPKGASERQLEEQKRANELLAALLEEQRQKKLDEFAPVVQGAV